MRLNGAIAGHAVHARQIAAQYDRGVALGFPLHRAQGLLTVLDLLDGESRSAQDGGHHGADFTIVLGDQDPPALSANRGPFVGAPPPAARRTRGQPDSYFRLASRRRRRGFTAASGNRKNPFYSVFTVSWSRLPRAR